MPFKSLTTLQFTKLAGVASFMVIVAGCTSTAPVPHALIEQPAARKDTETQALAPLPPASIAPASPSQPSEPRVIGLAEEIERNAMQMAPQ